MKVYRGELGGDGRREIIMGRMKEGGVDADVAVVDRAERNLNQKALIFSPGEVSMSGAFVTARDDESKEDSGASLASHFEIK